VLIFGQKVAGNQTHPPPPRSISLLVYRDHIHMGGITIEAIVCHKRQYSFQLEAHYQRKSENYLKP
jgi:hypothetical protein